MDKFICSVKDTDSLIHSGGDIPHLLARIALTSTEQFNLSGLFADLN